MHKSALKECIRAAGADGLGVWAAPFAAVYAGAVLGRRLLYDRGWLRRSPAPVFTISVGGIEAGGSGKTPVTGCLLAALLRAGRFPGLLSRGYGRQTSGLIIRRPGEPVCPLAVGDEPAMLVTSGIDVTVAACANRLCGAQALARLGCDAVILDDGFSHRALARDFDIVVVRGESLGARQHMLPWGPLREPLSSLQRAHLLWFHFKGGASSEGVGPGQEQWRLRVAACLSRYSPAAACVISQAHVGEARRVGGAPVSLADKRIVAAAGIARPQPFFEALVAAQAEVVARVVFRDHHRFTARDVTALRRLVACSGAEALVCTPKDAIKLQSLWPLDAEPLWQVSTEVRLVEGHATLAQILRVPVHALEEAGASTMAPAPCDQASPRRAID